ncbi:uncharacterized protein LOC102065479 isoform X2 [Zonotrichia albicollis]|uniref:uncharacterized protein LOC102065479 isoform X2 n=1 Tax=Zonotrichia albicollis TaxID=44394 RepID=UPI003D80D417
MRRRHGPATLPLTRVSVPRRPGCPVRGLTWGLRHRCLGEPGKMAGEARGVAGKAAARPGGSLRPRPIPRCSLNETFGAALRWGRSPTVGADAVHRKPRRGTTTVRSDEKPPQERAAPSGPRRAGARPEVRPGRGFAGSPWP